MRTNKPSVTIGVIAFNEEKSIGDLLHSLLKQRKNNFFFERIIVVSDGSIDDTTKIIRSLNNEKIKLIDSKTRKGKALRLNQIFELNKSDILVMFDADVIPLNDMVIENLVKEFNTNVVLVGGNRIPIAGKTLIEKIANYGHEIRADFIRNINKGNNIRNHTGKISAVTNDFARRINIPKNFSGTDDFIYLSAVQYKRKFKFARNAVVIYKGVDNLRDYIKQHGRFSVSERKMSEHFGNWIKEQFFVPKTQIYKAYITGLTKSPILTIGYLILEKIVRINLIFKKYDNSKFGWDISKSTKSSFRSTNNLKVNYD